MNVKELIKTLKTMPQDYEVVFESGDAYGSAYYAYVDDVIVKNKENVIELK